uniref:Uncharacterized protein n=1 Tax=Amphimedon queenslandica TaxID=400682 RepID=A0A1X7U8Q3_AMPQE
HLQYWLLFVKATSLLCTRYLHKDHVQLASTYLQLFCQKFEEINGKSACTLNMHLHLHLKDCLNNFGPLYSFWCYAFERYNGLLGSFPMKQKNIEPQLIKKCLMLQELHTQSFLSEGKFLENIIVDHLPLASGGHFSTMAGDDMLLYIYLSAPVLQDSLRIEVSHSDKEKLLPPLKQTVLDTIQVVYLQKTYSLLYPSGAFHYFAWFAKQSSRAFVLNEVGHVPQLPCQLIIEICLLQLDKSSFL